MVIELDKIKEIFKKYKYYPTEELLWRTFINLQKALNFENIGQDIYAICLEGPPGSGKSEYSKVYAKILSELSDEHVEFLRYTCNPTTGKESLYEDIRISSAIIGKNDDVIIPGILIEAIRKVNEGKKVIMFLDEYDKAKTETDGFLLEFLQDGRLMTTQIGQLLVKEKKDLQVILCKNDNRAELSPPLSRRLNTIRLEHMKPNLMVQVINDKMKNSDINIKTLVLILYNILYIYKDEFKKLPSCPEVMMAIQEAEILKNANCESKYIYSCIIGNMIKSEIDLYTFEKLISDNKELNKHILSFKEVFDKTNKDFNDSIHKTIYELFFKREIEQNQESQNLVQQNIISSDKNNLLANNENKTNLPITLEEIKVDTLYDFVCNDTTEGETKSKFDSSLKWYKTGYIDIPITKEDSLSKELLEIAYKIMYDGPVLYQDENYSLIAVKRQNKDSQIIEFYSSNLVMPTNALIKLKKVTTLFDNNAKFNFEFITPSQFIHKDKNDRNLVHVKTNSQEARLFDAFNDIGEIIIFSLKDKVLIVDGSNVKIDDSDIAPNSKPILETISKVYNIPFKEPIVIVNKSYDTLVSTNEMLIKIINYNDTSLSSLDLIELFHSAILANNKISSQLYTEFSETLQKRLKQKIFRKIN